MLIDTNTFHICKELLIEAGILISVAMFIGISIDLLTNGRLTDDK